MKELNREGWSLSLNLEYHRSRAKALLRDLRGGELYALREFSAFHPEGQLGEAVAKDRTFALHDAQLIIARTHGCVNWTQFKKWISERGPIPKDTIVIGIISENLPATKEFYTRFFGYSIHLEDAKGLIVRSPNGKRQLVFVRQRQDAKHPIAEKKFSGDGIYLTFTTDDVERDLEHFRAQGVVIERDLLTTSGEIQFMVRDPNGIGIYVSQPRFF